MPRTTGVLVAVMLATLFAFRPVRAWSVTQWAGVTRVVSPAVVATWLATFEDSSQAAKLEILVLWRGKPGWFGSGSAQTSGGGDERSYGTNARYGDVDLSVNVTFVPRTVKVRGTSVTMPPKTNALLVDNIDDPKPGAPKFLTVPSGMVDMRTIEPILRSSGELIEYLRCDAKVLDPRLQATLDRSCAAIIGR